MSISASAVPHPGFVTDVAGGTRTEMHGAFTFKRAREGGKMVGLGWREGGDASAVEPAARSKPLVRSNGRGLLTLTRLSAPEGPARFAE